MASSGTPVSPQAAASPARSVQPREVNRGTLALSALALSVLAAAHLIGGLVHLVRAARSTAGTGWSNSARLGLQALWIWLVCGIALYCIWHYRRGENGARLAVLLWSVIAAARALSFLGAHNFDPTALMVHPLAFFRALLAGALLYWLNTPAVAGWFRKVSATAAYLVGERLVGRLCTGLQLDSVHPLDDAASRPSFPAADSAAQWRLYFEHGAELVLRCPWRIVLDDNLAFVSAPALRDAPASPSPEFPSPEFSTPGFSTNAAPELPHSPQEARRLLQNLRVTAVRVAPRSSDLFVTFEMGIELQTWSPDASAARSVALPATPAASDAIATTAPLWSYSDPSLTVIADGRELQARFAAAPPDAASQTVRR